MLSAGSKRRDPKFPRNSQNRSPSTGRKPVVDGALDDGVDIAVLDRNDAAEPPRISREVPYDPCWPVGDVARRRNVEPQ